jgi:hypothetical protein
MKECFGVHEIANASFVISAKAGTPLPPRRRKKSGVPAFAGMTRFICPANFAILTKGRSFSSNQVQQITPVESR